MIDVEDYLKRYKEASLRTLDRISEVELSRVIEALERARDEGRQIFVCGNGGSAATATHFANDLGKGASVGRRLRFRVLSLTDNLAWISALANDLDYSEIFVEQLKNFAAPGDVLIAFSGSGNSPNVLSAVRWANAHGLQTVGFTGRPGGELGQMAKLAIFAESEHMGRIEDAHFVAQHLIGYFFMEQTETSSSQGKGLDRGV